MYSYITLEAIQCSEEECGMDKIQDHVWFVATQGSEKFHKIKCRLFRSCILFRAVLFWYFLCDKKNLTKRYRKESRTIKDHEQLNLLTCSLKEKKKH